MLPLSDLPKCCDTEKKQSATCGSFEAHSLRAKLDIELELSSIPLYIVMLLFYCIDHLKLNSNIVCTVGVNGV